MTIGVIGDAFVDKYWIGKSRGLSAEAPIPVVDIQETLEFPGGAANVRRNLGALECEAKLLIKGDKDNPNYPVKNRLIVDGVQVARWDEDDWCAEFEPADLLPLVGVDALIVSDYGKGAIGPRVQNILLSVANRIPVFVDTKKDPSLWLTTNATLFPNIKEYQQFEPTYRFFSKLILKQGSLGVSIVENGHVTYTIPALAKKVVSVNGAGDTVIATFAAYTMAGANITEALKASSVAAAIVVEKP
jgi:bifunctional ADP-heptose synthase (sugar kinase/adenylyltransferase)